VVAAKLLRSPEAAARFSETTVAAYSLPPSAIRRLREWQANVTAPPLSSVMAAGDPSGTPTR
jgi:hypothetical protein